MKEIKTLLVGVLGVLLVSGAFTAPAYARTSQSELDKVISQQSVMQSQGTVADMNVANMKLGWNVVNGDPNKIVNKEASGQLTSGWRSFNNGGGWRYFDPATNFLVRNQARVINGKEYFFDYRGCMIIDCNVDGSYYGLDGAKNGSARSGNGIGNYTTSRCMATNTEFEWHEFENQVRLGHIKAYVSYGYTGGSDVASGFLEFKYVG